MYEDLTKRYKLEGMTKNAVVEILGKPDRDTAECVEYRMGAVGADSSTALEIYLNDDLVIGQKIIREN